MFAVLRLMRRGEEGFFVTSWPPTDIVCRVVGTLLHCFQCVCRFKWASFLDRFERDVENTVSRSVLD